MQLSFRLDKRSGESHLALDGKKIKWVVPNQGRGCFFGLFVFDLVGSLFCFLVLVVFFLLHRSL